MLFNQPKSARPRGGIYIPISIHGSLDPPNSASQTASRSVWPFLHSLMIIPIFYNVY